MEITDGFPAQSQHIGKYSVPPVKTQSFTTKHKTMV